MKQFEEVNKNLNKCLYTKQNNVYIIINESVISTWPLPLMLRVSVSTLLRQVSSADNTDLYQMLSSWERSATSNFTFKVPVLLDQFSHHWLDTSNFSFKAQLFATHQWFALNSYCEELHLNTKLLQLKRGETILEGSAVTAEPRLMSMKQFEEVNSMKISVYTKAWMQKQHVWYIHLIQQSSLKLAILPIHALNRKHAVYIQHANAMHIYSFLILKNNYMYRMDACTYTFHF